MSNTLMPAKGSFSITRLSTLFFVVMPFRDKYGIRAVDRPMGYRKLARGPTLPAAPKVCMV
jgi:hypothetical protein